MDRPGWVAIDRPRRFQVVVSPRAWEALLKSASRDRRSVKEQAGWMLEERLLGGEAGQTEGDE